MCSSLFTAQKKSLFVVFLQASVERRTKGRNADKLQAGVILSVLKGGWNPARGADKNAGV